MIYIKFHVSMVNDDKKTSNRWLNYFITIICLVMYLQTIESSPTESSEGRPVMPSPESPTITYTQQQQPKGEYHTADDSLLTSHYHITSTTTSSHHPPHHSKSTTISYSFLHHDHHNPHHHRGLYHFLRGKIYYLKLKTIRVPFIAHA